MCELVFPKYWVGKIFIKVFHKMIYIKEVYELFGQYTIIRLNFGLVALHVY